MLPTHINFDHIPIPDTPNYYLACPKGYCPQKTANITPTFNRNLMQLTQAWQTVMHNQPRITQIYTDPTKHEYTYIQRSFLFRFPDYIYVKFIALDNNTSSLIIFSRSKYGYSDLGVNKRRVLRWLKELAKIIVTD